MTATILLALAATVISNAIVMLHAMRHAESKPCPVPVPTRIGPQRSRLPSVPVLLTRGQIIDMEA